MGAWFRARASEATTWVGIVLAIAHIVGLTLSKVQVSELAEGLSVLVGEWMAAKRG
jgi:hypothetical protein